MSNLDEPIFESFNPEPHTTGAQVGPETEKNNQILDAIKELKELIHKMSAINGSVDFSTLEQKLVDLQETLKLDIKQICGGHFDERWKKLDEKIEDIDETARDISSSFNQQTQIVRNLGETLQNLNEATQRMVSVPSQWEQVYNQLDNLSIVIDKSVEDAQLLHRQTKEDISTALQAVFVQFKSEVLKGLGELQTSLCTMKSSKDEVTATRVEAVQRKIESLAETIAAQTRSWNGSFSNLEQNISNKVKTTLNESVPKVINNAQITGGIANAVNATIAQAIQNAISSECNALGAKTKEIAKKVDLAQTQLKTIQANINTDVANQIRTLKEKGRENANYLLFTLVFSLVCGLSTILLVLGKSSLTIVPAPIFLTASIFIALSIESIILFGFLRALYKDFQGKRILWYYICTGLVTVTAFVLSMIISFWG